MVEMRFVNVFIFGISQNKRKGEIIMKKGSNYVEHLRLIKSLLIVTSLQKRTDLKAVKIIRLFDKKISWKPLSKLLIDPEVWHYAVDIQGYDPKLVFCHPEIILEKPPTSLYYRGLCGLSIKAVKDYFGAVEMLEKGSLRAKLSREKAIKMARTYNTFICSIIKNSTEWTLDNGCRTIVATLGISIDGTMRNQVGKIAEDRIRTLILEWANNQGIIIKPKLKEEDIFDSSNRSFLLQQNIIMEFKCEPDISFSRDKELLAVIEIKGGIDPAGALERYGAAKKSFEHSVGISKRCKNIYLGAVYTAELERRISEDRLVEKFYNIIEILEKPEIGEDFFNELFHHTLRLT